jgi:hypothetical protein
MQLLRKYLKLFCHVFVFVMLPFLTYIPSSAQITCVDYRGIQVVSISAAGLMDIAMAGIAPTGGPAIYYNPNAVPWFSPQTQLFFYAHECAHHVLAHIAQGVSFQQEQEADCWGIVTLYDRGLISDIGVRFIQSDLARAGRADWTHLPGPIRGINLIGCLTQFSIAYRQQHQPPFLR